MDISDKGTVFMYNSNNESRGKQGVPETMATGSERHKMPRLLTALILKAGAEGHSMQHLVPVLDVSYDLLNQWRQNERRVGKECVGTCRSRCSPDLSKKNNYIKNIQPLLQNEI